MVGNIFKKLKKHKSSISNPIEGFVPPKPAHRWQRRKRQEEQEDKKRQEHVTMNKVDPWFQANTHPRGQEVTVLYSFDGGFHENDLKCLKGDILTIESNDRSGAWWEAINTRTNERGFVPGNFVTEEPGVGGILDAWHDIDRRESEAKLNMEGLPAGTYIIRPSFNPLRISLSVLCIVGSTKIIKHFKVNEEACMGGFFLTPSRGFAKLENLIEFYKEPRDGSPSLLSSPWPRQLPAVQSRDLVIPSDKLDLSNRLSTGGRFGPIYYATYGLVRQPVVVKKLHRSIRSAAVLKAIAEANHKLHSEHIVNFVGMSPEQFLVMEYMPGGTLKNYLTTSGSDAGSTRLLGLLHQVVDGMDYLENVQSFHGELRAENIFLSRELTAKIANFGFYNAVNSKPFAERDAVRWAAPEVLKLNNTSNFGIRADVWSFGVVMYEVFTRGATPYDQMTNDEVSTQVRSGYRLPCPQSTEVADCSSTIYSTMRDCWNLDPSERPTFRELWFVFDEYLSDNKDVYAEIN